MPTELDLTKMIPYLESVMEVQVDIRVAQKHSIREDIQELADYYGFTYSTLCISSEDIVYYFSKEDLERVSKVLRPTMLKRLNKVRSYIRDFEEGCRPLSMVLLQDIAWTAWLDFRYLFYLLDGNYLGNELAFFSYAKALRSDVLYLVQVCYVKPSR